MSWSPTAIFLDFKYSPWTSQHPNSRSLACSRCLGEGPAWRHSGAVPRGATVNRWLSSNPLKFVFNRICRICECWTEMMALVIWGKLGQIGAIWGNLGQWKFHHDKFVDLSAFASGQLKNHEVAIPFLFRHLRSSHSIPVITGHHRSSSIEKQFSRWNDGQAVEKEEYWNRWGRHYVFGTWCGGQWWTVVDRGGPLTQKSQPIRTPPWWGFDKPSNNLNLAVVTTSCTTWS